MSAGPQLNYTIEVKNGIGQVLDLITKKREFVLLSESGSFAPEQEKRLQREGYTWVKVANPKGSTETGCGKDYCLVFGGLAASRDAASWTLKLPDLLVKMGIAPMCPRLKRLHELCEGMVLKYDVISESEVEANKYWLREILRLGANPGKWYASDDYSSIKIAFHRVTESTEESDGEESATTPAPIDVAEFDVYDRLRDILEQRAQDSEVGYGDDVFVEYGIRSHEGVARYCATEFYTNHNWNWDPANLLVVRLCGEVLPGECAPCDVQFSHPSKTTIRKSSRKRYLVDTLTMSNDVKVKFNSGKGKEEQHPDTKVSADRTMDNLVDFSAWLDMHRHEIELL